MLGSGISIHVTRYDFRQCVLIVQEVFSMGSCHLLLVGVELQRVFS